MGISNVKGVAFFTDSIGFGSNSKPNTGYINHISWQYPHPIIRPSFNWMGSPQHIQNILDDKSHELKDVNTCWVNCGIWDASDNGITPKTSLEEYRNNLEFLTGVLSARYENVQWCGSTRAAGGTSQHRILKFNHEIQKYDDVMIEVAQRHGHLVFSMQWLQGVLGWKPLQSSAPVEVHFSNESVRDQASVIAGFLKARA